MNKTLKVSLIIAASGLAFFIGYKLWKKNKGKNEVSSLSENTKTETPPAETPKQKIGDGWDESYWMSAGGIRPTDQSAIDISKQIRKWIGDPNKVLPNWIGSSDEDAIMNYFNTQVQSRAYLSKIAYMYKKLYNVSLKEDIKRIGSSDVAKVYKMADALPYGN